MTRLPSSNTSVAWPIGLSLLAVQLWMPVATRSEPTSGSDKPSADKISFDRDVRPILSNHCWKCHGPDAKERKAGLRLDQLDSVTKPAESGKTAVVPNKPADSELVRRILSSDSDEQMPPASENKPLSGPERRPQALDRTGSNF